MDKQGKGVIVGLILLGLLFALGLGTHLLPTRGDGASDGWLESLDRLAGRLRPGLDRTRLRPGVGCRQKAGAFEFDEDGMHCEITVAATGADYQTGSLVVSNAAEVRVPCPENGAAAATRGGTAPARLTFVDPTLRPARIKPGETSTPGAAPAVTVLEVVYTPSGEEAPAPACRAQDEIRLVVLGDGGRLVLRCSGCSPGRVVRVGVRQ